MRRTAGRLTAPVQVSSPVGHPCGSLLKLPASSKLAGSYPFTSFTASSNIPSVSAMSLSVWL
jgi:hypothetical protein